MVYDNKTIKEQAVSLNQSKTDEYCDRAENYLYGSDGYDKDYTQAYQLLHKAEKKGNGRAYALLGYMYINGIFFMKNETLANEYFAKAKSVICNCIRGVNTGNDTDLLRLSGLYYISGQIEEYKKNRPEAMRCYINALKYNASMMSESKERKTGLAKILSAIGETEQKLGHVDKAEIWIKEAGTIKENVNKL